MQDTHSPVHPVTKVVKGKQITACGMMGCWSFNVAHPVCWLIMQISINVRIRNPDWRRELHIWSSREQSLGEFMFYKFKLLIISFSSSGIKDP